MRRPVGSGADVSPLIRFQVRSGPALNLPPSLAPLKLEFWGLRAHAGWAADKTFNSDIGGLLPIAQCGREVSGIVQDGSVSWQLVRQRGLSVWNGGGAGSYAGTRLICLLLFLRCSRNAAVMARSVSRVLGSVRDECKIMDNEGMAGRSSI